MRNFGQNSYGNLWDKWNKLYDWVTPEVDESGRTAGQAQATGGMCTDQAGLLGRPGARVPCARLRERQEGVPEGTYTSYVPIPDANGEEPPPPAAPKVPWWLYGVIGTAIVGGFYTISKIKRN